MERTSIVSIINLKVTPRLSAPRKLAKGINPIDLSAMTAT